MIFQKGGMWKISGYAQKYATYEEATAALNKINKIVEKKVAEAVTIKERMEVAAKAAMEEAIAKADLAEDSTPYEKMILKNICLICNLEPCECGN